MDLAVRIVPYEACRALPHGQSRAHVVAALGSAPALEVLLNDGEGGITSTRWPAFEASGAPGWLYVSFDRDDRVLGHALIPRVT